MSPVEGSWAAEAPRDQSETGFTPILRRLLYREDGVLAAVFVDGEGECVDYCSALPPFDAKVNAAHLLIVMTELSATLLDRAGQSWMLEVQASERDLIIRRVDDDYLLVLVTKPRVMNQRVVSAIEKAVVQLRQEAQVETPSWEPYGGSLIVETRRAEVWPYVPSALIQDEVRVGIEDVIGRWTEGTGQQRRVCFRVRTEKGEELTLMHRQGLDRWELARDPDSERKY